MGEAENPTDPQPQQGWVAWLSRRFELTAHQTTIRTEILAGITTFMTMAYILVVNPQILSNAIYLQKPQDLFAELVIATGISAALATFQMGLTTNYPFALAPGMGLNAFFAFSVVLKLGIEWRVALTAVFLEGLLFIALTLSKLRSRIIQAIPASLKQAIAAGIGLFIAYIALSGNPKLGGVGLIVADPVTKTALGPLNEPSTLMAIAGLIITTALVARRVKGALLWGILATALLGWILGVSPWPTAILGIPHWPTHLFGQAIVGLAGISNTQFWDFVTVTFVFLFIDLFDTVGTLAGVGLQSGYVNERGDLPKASQAFMADAVGTTVGAVLGTSTVTAYIESAAGVAVGGRTGLTAMVVGVLFTLSIFFIPLLIAIPAYATVPALVLVGVLMMGNVRSIPWDDPAEAIPAFLTILLMPLSYSIAEGLAIGFIAYPLVKSFQGKMREVSGFVWALAGVFVLRFVLLSLNIGG